MVIIVAMMLLLGMLEFGMVFDHHLSLEYATREGARIAAALANGGGTMGCGTGQSPNAANVDKQIVAAVQRVLKSPGSPIDASRVSEIRIFETTSSGAQNGSLANVWTYNMPSGGGGPTVDGVALDFSQSGAAGWSACSRDNGATPDSVGVSITYSYRLATPLAGIVGAFGSPGSAQITITDKTVMALNPS
jgi:TadE-like protein